jgi:hypothetical protein
MVDIQDHWHGYKFYLSNFSVTMLLNMVMVEFSYFLGGYKNCNSQCGTKKFCMLTDLGSINNSCKKKKNMAGGWKFKFTLYFIEKTHEPLHLDKVRYNRRSRTYLQVFIIIFFKRAFEYGNGGILKLTRWKQIYTSQCGTMKFCMLINHEKINNFCKKRKI